MTDHTATTDTDELAELYSELTDGSVVTIHQQEGASKAVIDTTDGSDTDSATGLVDPSANPLEDAIGDPEGG